MALEGNLRDMALADLLQVFWMGSKTGILLLIAGPERGVIYVRDGRLIDAVLVRGPRRQVAAAAEDAMIHMLQWEDARFTFRPHPTVAGRPVRIVHDREWLLAEGMRRRTSVLHALPLDRITPDTQLRLAALPGRAESGINLNLDQWRILSRLANSRNVRDICEEISLELDRAIHLVAELVVFGLVEIVLPSPAHEGM
jgi:hypothetical protein